MIALSAFTPPAYQQTAAPAGTANPLIAPWTGPYGGVPPWDQAKAQFFPAAFEAALAQQRAEIDAIVANPAPPDFDNTIAAMQRAGQALDRVGRMFSVMTDNMSTAEFQKLDHEWQPKLAAAADAIAFNPGLFKRIEAVYAFQAAATTNLPPEQQRLTVRTYDNFVRRGARLGDAQKARLSEFNQSLAGLFSVFSASVLADEDTWTVLDRETDLAGLPASLVAAAKAAAEERKLPGKWAIVNTRSSVDPFLTFSTRRDLRERVWKKFKSRGDNGDRERHEGDHRGDREASSRTREAAGLRQSHAHWRMADTMAVDPKAAQALMMQVWPAAVARVKEEVADMQAIAGRRPSRDHHRAVGLPLLRREGAQGQVRPRPG